MIGNLYHNFNKSITFYYILRMILISSRFFLSLFLIIFLFYKHTLSNDNGCFSYECFEDRTINVLVVYDLKYYSEESIEKLIIERLSKVNEFYYSQFKINWNIFEKVGFYYNEDIENISELYSFHKTEILNLIKKSRADIILSIVAHDIKGLGIAGTFSNYAMVSNLEKLDLDTGSIIIAHEFGHLFGAWHTQKTNDFMLLSGANTFDTSKESKAILKLMRNYNFLPDSIINNVSLLKRISRIYQRHHARFEIDPVARLLTDSGNEAYKNKDYIKAEKILNNSLSYYGKWGKTRMILSKTYYELKKYDESFLELTRAIFFGAKPDLLFEKKLKNKFVELQNIDSNIINPFITK